ncbi:hypothetical protein KIW84_031608 [Lathyrus oleraceus]|uniref:CTLH domain-containing protein n=1 Tax=Pisum sativum TaxID=3888 RepID=A0A9D4XVC1_PEA|nr:hypothetical protein KIW84_031608 [Pisum sativum]
MKLLWKTHMRLQVIKLVFALFVVTLLCLAESKKAKIVTASFEYNGINCRAHSVSSTDFGGVGDGVTSSTKAFQSAISNLSQYGSEGGSQLFVPAGKWLTGSFSLTSHFTLYLDKDAVLLASQDITELEKESGFYFNMKYFEEKVQAGEWDEVEKYLSGFTKVDDNRYSMKIFFEIRKQKYLEALDRQDKAKVVEILVGDLKVFATFNEELYKEITQLLTLTNFRENEQLSKYVVKIADINQSKFEPAAPALQKNPRPNPDIKTLFIDHSCSPSNGPLAPTPVNLPVSAVAKPAAYTSLGVGAHGPFPPAAATTNANALAGWPMPQFRHLSKQLLSPHQPYLSQPTSVASHAPLQIHANHSQNSRHKDHFVRKNLLLELLHFIEDFLIKGRVILKDIVPTETSSDIDFINDSFLDGVDTSCSKEATDEQLVAAGIILASICAATDYIGFLYEASYNILRLCRYGSFMALTILHIFANLGGKKYFDSCSFGLTVTVLKSLVMFLEGGSISVTPASCLPSINQLRIDLCTNNKCPFSEGAESIDVVTFLLLEKIKKHLFQQGQFDSSSFKSLLDNHNNGQWSSQDVVPYVHIDVTLCQLSDILSLLELVASKMGWQWTNTKLVPQLLHVLDSCVVENAAVAIIALLGQLGRFGVDAGGYKDQGVENKRSNAYPFMRSLPSPTTTYLGPKCPNTLASIQDNNTTCLHQVQTTEDITAGANQSSHVVHHGSSCIQHQVQAITANLQNSNNQQQGSV